MSIKSEEILAKLQNEHAKLIEISGNNTDPINLTHFRSFTGGDKEKEKELFNLFESTVDECLGILKQNIDDNEVWKKTVHSLQGAAATLGAESLSQLCQNSESIKELSQKERIVTEVEDECHEVINQMGGLLD